MRDGSERTVRSIHPDAVAYNVQFDLPDEPARDGGLLVSPRRFCVGDIVNLPDPPDDRPRGGKGYIWRVTAVDDEPPSIWVEFVRPHPDMVIT
jgi:hypothetical protein